MLQYWGNSYQFAVPAFITSGLVLHLDAGSASSYSGSGSTWSDISGNGRNATLFNSPTYSSANGGSLVFDGNTKYASVASNAAFNLNSAFTFSLWVKRNGNAIQTDEVLLHREVGYAGPTQDGGYQLAAERSTLLPKIGIRNNLNIPDILTASTAIASSWVNIVAAYGASTLRLYTNESTAGSKTSSISVGSTTSALSIGGVGSGYAFNGNIAQVAMYNRELSASEISQNFNALRGRFGI
jgi:hypothetical protein